MPPRFISRLHWQISYYLGDFGWASVIAVILFGGAASFFFFQLLPLQEQIIQTQKNINILYKHASTASDTPKILTPAEQLSHFYDYFPIYEDIPDDIATILNIASERNINIVQADYQLFSAIETRLGRYEMVIAVKGGYSEIRQFLSAALDELPNLALDSINYTRQKIGDNQVEVQMRLVFYFNQES